MPLIGFDVLMETKTFIQDGQNGYLIPSSDDHVEMEIKGPSRKNLPALSGKSLAEYENSIL